MTVQEIGGQDLGPQEASTGQPSAPDSLTLLTAAYRRPWFKRVLPRSLFGRAVLIIVTPLVLLQIVSTWIFYDRHYDMVTKRLSQAVAGEVAVIVEMINRPAAEWPLERIYFLAKHRLRVDAELLPTGELMQPPESFWPSLLEDKLTKALSQRVFFPFVIDTRSDPDRVEIQVDLGDQVLRAVVSRERLFTSTTYLFIIWTVGTSVVLFIIASLFMRNQVRPIRRLASAADRFGKGLDVADFRPEGAAEVRQAAIAFLRMRERIKRQIQQRTEMLAGVSHDLRTPMTRIKLELAMLGGGPAIESLRADIAQMEKMVEGYLAFARGEGTEEPQATDLADLLRQVVEEARREGTQVDLHLEQALPATLRREAMRRCLANLISNARRYGKQIAVTAGRRKGGIEVLVDDDGPGIPPDKREDVFKAFFRLDESRNPETGGTGLGLTIARDVVRSHGGDLSLHEAPGGGLRAQIWLPR